MYQDQLVDRLQALSRQGKARWFQRTADPAYVFCVVNREILRFETFGSEGKPAPPTSSIHGIGADVRNLSLLWLESSESWQTLLDLLRKAPIEDDEWPKALAASKCRLLEDFDCLVNT